MTVKTSQPTCIWHSGHDFWLQGSKHCHVLFQLIHIAQTYLSNLTSFYFSTHTIGAGQSGVHTISSNIKCCAFVHPGPLLEYLLLPLETQIPLIIQGNTSTISSVFTHLPVLSISIVYHAFPILAHHHYFMDVNHFYKNIF